MSDEDPLLKPWDVFGFGAFETTAFTTAVLVGAYSFILDPTGQQDAGDVSEIRIYRQWRLGVVLVGLDVLFKLGVLVLQVLNGRRARVVVWTLLLMAVPWAPFFSKVVKSFLAWRSVRRLMRERVARNELSALMRDYLMLGNQSLTTARVAHEVGRHQFNLPRTSLQDVLKERLEGTQRQRFHTDDAAEQQRHEREDEVQRQANNNFVEGVREMVLSSSWLATRRELRRGPHPALGRWFKWWRFFRRLDCWTLAWTVRTIPPRVDPFPTGMLPTDKKAAGALDEERGRPSLYPRVTDPRACILDVIDDSNGARTLSQARSSHSLPESLCSRCALAVRGAVETFLESSDRAHADVCASEWLDNVRIDWRGNMEVILDVLWEAAFVDNNALRVEPLRVEDGTHDGARGDRQQPGAPSPSIITTQKLLVFLFLVARSVLGCCPDLDGVCDRIKKRLHQREWWNDYWTTLLDSLPRSEGLSVPRATKVKAQVLRKRTAVELNAVLDELERTPPAVYLEGKGHDGKDVHLGGLCGFSRCFLSEDTNLVVTRVPPTAEENTG